MDYLRFDALAKNVARQRSRRDVVKGLAAGVLGTLGMARGGGALAKKEDKVTICHKPGTSAENTLTVASSAVAAHLGHGDYINPNGCCPAGTVVIRHSDGTADCCKPVTCEDAGANCGEISDQCGAAISCGTCDAPETCGGGGVENVCGCTADPDETCADACGIVQDACGQEVDCGPCCTPDLETCAADVECCSGTCTCGTNAEAGHCQAPFFQGFDSDASGWSGVVASGGVGLLTKDGGEFTRWGGYGATFPAGGYTTSVDIYLDMGANPAVGTDLRMDYSSAINGTDCNHRRDFIFNIGTDPTTAGQWVVSASNNAPGWPSNPGRDPFEILVSGWYTFTHQFYDIGGGQLACDLSISGPGGTHTWTLTDPSDIIGVTVGGNRYGLFADNAFDGIQIDNSSRS